MQRGDIWLVSLDPTAGHEQQGTRPVVIVSPAAFNDLTGTPVVLPITTGGSFARRRGFAVSLFGHAQAQQLGRGFDPASFSVNRRSVP